MYTARINGVIVKESEFLEDVKKWIDDFVISIEKLNHNLRESGGITGLGFQNLDDQFKQSLFIDIYKDDEQICF